MPENMPLSKHFKFSELIKTSHTEFAAEQVTSLESKYQLPRPVRTALLLACEAGQKVDAELMARVNEIEALAVPLRQHEDAEGAA